MEIAEIRRNRLRLWFADRTLPEKEKSYLSQLMTGKASFGERAARRLERDYGMGVGFLDERPTDETVATEERPGVDSADAVFELVDLFSRCDDHGRTFILAAARSQAEESPASKGDHLPAGRKRVR